MTITTFMQKKRSIKVKCKNIFICSLQQHVFQSVLISMTNISRVLDSLIKPGSPEETFSSLQFGGNLITADMTALCTLFQKRQFVMDLSLQIIVSKSAP